MSSRRRYLEQLVDIVPFANTDSKYRHTLPLERTGGSAHAVLGTTIRHHDHHRLSATAPAPKQNPLRIIHR